MSRTTAFAALVILLLAALPYPAFAEGARECPVETVRNYVGIYNNLPGTPRQGGRLEQSIPWVGQHVRFMDRNMGETHASVSWEVGECVGVGVDGSVGQPSQPPPGQQPPPPRREPGQEGESDSDGDGMGDSFVDYWARNAGQLLQPAIDSDGDNLTNLREFQWELIPICIPVAQNCWDFERNATTGAGGDGWRDGDEVAYWNDESNDPERVPVSTTLQLALYDPDRHLDTDGDLVPNVGDVDADNDGLRDGDEAAVGSYPEFQDSDCAIATTPAPCTPSSRSHLTDTTRQGSPGAGDRIADGPELAAWNRLGAGKHATDFDGDGISDNLLDPDSDGDSLLDGQEFNTTQIRPDLRDTDGDGLLDGQEFAWDQDTDGDGRLNANDPDADGDGMPDKWESDHKLNMADATDAGLDRDGDGLLNLEEYLWHTDPEDMDSEVAGVDGGDGLLDGEEVHTYHTDPLHWDTDRDGMPDRFEADHHFNPLNAADASQDPDGDSFDRGFDGSIEKRWPNLDEYRYGRPTGYNEAQRGPWPLGTNPERWDTDGDGGSDGYEVYYNSNPIVPADADTDKDGDGLNFTMEVRLQTNPEDADTDHDGLCDGGRGPNCHLLSFIAVGGYQPGERDYGTVPWMTDSDGDHISDSWEVELWDRSGSGTATDVDGDGLNGLMDWDSDGDWLSDSVEQYQSHTDPALSDTDHDGVIDSREDYLCSTAYLGCTVYYDHMDPHDADTDDDGLLDGAELQAHTYPNWRDTDGDGLLDGDEVAVYHTDPLRADTDGDRILDGVEVKWHTNPLVDDARTDADQDGLSNWDELFVVPRSIGRATDPLNPDTDGDTLLDGWEFSIYVQVDKWWFDFYKADFNPTVPTASTDTDRDGLTLAQEFLLGTSPIDANTDGDWDNLPDGEEVNNYKTDPLKWDSDGDGLSDSYSSYSTTWKGELQLWTSRFGAASIWIDYDHDQSTNNLLDKDADNDTLDDGVEFNRGLDPTKADTDGDGLTDWQEVTVFKGRFNPRLYDTDGDGYNDMQELAFDDPTADPDHDNLDNDHEAMYGTLNDNPDSDCDGVQDGPELNYWHSDWNTGGNRLRNADVDGDGLKDGLEIGWIGTPREVLYHTDPELADTDGDRLADNNEDRNSLAVACGGPVQSAPMAGVPLGVPTPSVPEPPLSIGPGGLPYGADERGVYIQGGFGVKMYLTEPMNGNETDLDFLHEAPRASSTNQNTYKTNPMLWDTDGDGISDGDEVDGTPPAPVPQRSNPTQCDSDGDGLGDDLEAGVIGVTGKITDPCTHRDLDPSNLPTDPMKADTDNDGLLDGSEDKSRNGVVDVDESNPADADTDDDGILDPNEAVHKTLSMVADSDGDGLSDGLEAGLKTPEKDLAGFVWTSYATPLEPCSTDRKAWQPYQGATGAILSAPDDADSDNDGILDGLEDLNHNGVYGDAGELSPRNADFDGDGLLDGLELLIWGQSNADGTHGTLTYNFCDVLSAWGGEGTLASHMQFNAGNPWQTNPRNSNTDSATESANNAVGVPDGKDLNPRGDALLSIKLSNFQMLSPPDYDGFCTPAPGTCYTSDEWYMEMFVDKVNIKMPLSNAEYTLGTTEAARTPSFYAKDPMDLPGKLFDDLQSQSAWQHVPTGFGALWNVKAVASEGVLTFDIPDNAASLNLQNDAIVISIHAKDYDYANANDDLDFSDKTGQSDLIHSIKLGEDAKGALGAASDPQYLVYQGGAQDYVGNEDRGDIAKAKLAVNAGDTVPSWFLEALHRSPLTLPTGTCLGSTSCVN